MKIEAHPQLEVNCSPRGRVRYRMRVSRPHTSTLHSGKAMYCQKICWREAGAKTTEEEGVFVRTDPSRDLTIAIICPAGLRKILKVVGQVPDLPSCLPLTDNTRMLASVLINKLYDDLRCDPERDHFRKICEEYIT